MSDKITKRSNQDKEFLKAKTVYSIPDNPSNKGFSAHQIKSKIADPSLILFDWLKVLSEETYEGFKEYDENIDEMVKEAGEKYLGSKLDKSSSANVIYATDEDGEQEVIAKSVFEKASNKTTTINDSSTDVQYPSAKVVYDYVSPLVSAVSSIEDDVDSIEEKIPSQATAQNQLADKDFVNSSVATNTAYFKGTYNVVSDLELTTSASHSDIAAELESVVSNPTNNDYVFVSFPDATVSTQFTKFERYKYNSTTEEWSFEFELNNSSFTAEQWASINSGITASMVAKIVTLDTDQTIGGVKTIGDNSAGNSPYLYFENRYAKKGIRLVAYNFNIDASLLPSYGVAVDMGTDNEYYKFRNGYFSGQVYAENTLNVINASDITNNALTPAQYDLITNGKPTLLLNYNNTNGRNAFITPLYLSGNYYRGVITQNYYISSVRVHKDTRVITYDERILGIANVGEINNKSIPAYPSSPATPQVLTYGTNNTLSWQTNPPQWYGTQAEYDALASYDSNTIYNILES